jgi:ammonia channel protein AmtB
VCACLCLRYAAGVHAFARIFKKKPSMLGAVCGAIAGLVVITRIFVAACCSIVHVEQKLITPAIDKSPATQDLAFAPYVYQHEVQ